MGFLFCIFLDKKIDHFFSPQQGQPGSPGVAKWVSSIRDHPGLLDFLFFFNIYLFIYLAVPGVSCSVWHLVP